MVRKKYLFSPKKGYTYVRVGGRYLGRVTAPEGTQEFDKQYWEILRGKPSISRTSWSALISNYKRSDRYAKLKPATRKSYDRVLLYILEKNGSKDMTKLRRKDVIAAMQANLHRSRFANAIPAIMSVLCEHAIDLGWIKENPAKGTRRVPIPEDKQKPHVPWTDEAVAKFRCEALALPRLIFEIGIGTVQRPGDWVHLTWGDYDGESLRLTQGKTGLRLVLPCTDELKETLDRTKASLGIAPLPTRHIITGQRGRSLTYHGMQQIMYKERKRLGLLQYDLHALRYRGVMELAWAGCDDEQIASYSGHATRDMIIKYAGEARQIMRARQAQDARRKRFE